MAMLFTHEGKTCRALVILQDPRSSVKIRPGTEGIVLHEIPESAEQRHLIMVRWESGTFYVYPNEIEISD